MHKRIIVLYIVLAVVLGGSFVFSEDAEGVKKYRRRQMKDGGADRVQARINELSAQLNLTSEQKEKVKDIFAQAKKETKDVLEEARIKVKKIKVKVDEGIRAILTEEQKNKFQGQGQAGCSKNKNEKTENLKTEKQKELKN